MFVSVVIKRTIHTYQLFLYMAMYISEPLLPPTIRPGSFTAKPLPHSTLQRVEIYWQVS